MKTWLDVRSTVLDEMVTLDGPGSKKLDLCHSCGNSQAMPLYRCIECSHSLLYCSKCILKLHTALPLHRLEVCSYFRPYTFMLITSSAGGMGFLTGPLSIRLGLSAILGMAVTCAPQTPLTAYLPSLTSTVGINCECDFASAVQVTYPTRTTANSFACAGIPRHFTARKRPSHSTSSIHITK